MCHELCEQHVFIVFCMIDSKHENRRICKKNFSKLFQSKTLIAENNYFLYTKRQNNRTWNKRVYKINVIMNNFWIVFYNSHLICKYNAHINTKLCASVQIIKYIHKYVFKDCDCTILQIQNDNDEIVQYLANCYIKSFQITWSILKHKSHIEFFFIIYLNVHLSDEQFVYFELNFTRENSKTIMNEVNFTLTIFFKYNWLHAKEREFL